ncbi:MAG: EamA/RhaT family transporter [Thermoplasmata archaeon]|nr:MAG: EamA/RhaT family transporter [Thermoplasmata archaeon]
MDDQKRGYIYAVVSVLLWSTVASAFKITLKQLDVLQLLLISSITSLLVLFVFSYKKLGVLRRYHLRDYLYSLPLGFLNPSLYYLVLFKAYSLLPAQEAQALNYTWPLIVVILSIPILNQKVTIVEIIGMVIGFLGVLLVVTHGDIKVLWRGELIGVTLALTSAVIWSIYWLLTIRCSGDETIRLLLNFSFGLIPISILYFLTMQQFNINTLGLLGGVYVGVFEMGLTFTVWLKALSYSSTTTQVSILIYLVPFLSLFFIHFFVGEEIYITTILGLILILIGIILTRYQNILYHKK